MGGSGDELGGQLYWSTQSVGAGAVGGSARSQNDRAASKGGLKVGYKRA